MRGSKAVPGRLYWMRSPHQAAFIWLITSPDFLVGWELRDLTLFTMDRKGMVKDFGNRDDYQHQDGEEWVR